MKMKIHILSIANDGFAQPILATHDYELAIAGFKEKVSTFSYDADIKGLYGIDHINNEAYTLVTLPVK